MSILKLSLSASLLALALLGPSLPALAADSPSTTDTSAASTSTAPSLKEVRARIAAKDWSAAVKLLNAIVDADSSNADAFNLLGYSLRNLGQYDQAGKAYATALRLNPRHLGALEYQGVLFIKLGQLDKARANLDKLKSLCGTDCEEYEDLAKALK